MADELASTVEHLLSTRYAARRLAEESPSTRVVPTVTSESLLAELAAARKSGPAEPRAVVAEEPRRARSPALRLFAVVGVAMIVYALLMKSPWRDQLPSPDRIAHLLN